MGNEVHSNKNGAIEFEIEIDEIDTQYNVVVQQTIVEEIVEKVVEKPGPIQETESKTIETAEPHCNTNNQKSHMVHKNDNDWRCGQADEYIRWVNDLELGMFSLKKYPIFSKK